MDHLGRIIKQQRTAMGLSLRELAALSGVSRSHLGRINEENVFPRPTSAEKLPVTVTDRGDR